jgi:hypothetical protein
MRGHNRLSDTQTKSRAAFFTAAGLIHAVKTLEYAGKMLGGDSDARVLKSHQGGMVLPLDLYIDLPTSGRVLDRIVQQVEENLPETGLVSPDPHLFVVSDVQIESLGLGQRAHRFHHTFHQGL